MFVVRVFKHETIPHICHFFTQAKFSEKKIYTEIYTVNCQFFALNLQKFTPAKKNLHWYSRGSRDKLEV